MLIHPWDTFAEEAWRAWLGTQRVGTLVVPTPDLPVVVPTHFLWTGSQVLLHLARPNPAVVALEAAVEAAREALFSVHGDWAYVPSYAKVVPGEDPARGIPTSYYAAVTLTCRVEVLTGDALAELLRSQLDVFEPGSGVADPAVHARLLPGIRGLRLSPVAVQAKAKYGGNADAEHQAVAAAHLRAQGATGALAQLLGQDALHEPHR